MTRIACVAALVSALALGAAGCDGDGGGKGSDKETQQHRAGTTYDDYVALGDSYTAAPFVPSRRPAKGCERSTGNYPSLVAERIGATLEDRSCSSASTDDMTGKQRPNLEPQLDAIDSGTDLVTLSIGGANDKLFPILVGGCSGVRQQDPDGAPCKESLNKSGSDELLSRIDGIEEDIVDVLEEIERRGPNARVLVVGYPAIFPEQGSCPDLLPLAAGDTTYAAEVMAAMVEAQRSAAERAGVEFVDVYAATRGHDICADDPWIQGKENDRRKAMAFHPFAKEQEVAAGLIVTLLR